MTRSSANILISHDVLKDMAFPLACIQCDQHPDNVLHRHPFHELVLILAGTGQHIAGDTAYHIQAGDAFLIHEKIAHRYAQTNNLSLVNILFDPRRINLPVAELLELPGYQLLFLIAPQLRSQRTGLGQLRLLPHELVEAKSLIAKLRKELADRENGYRFAARLQLMTLLLFLSRLHNGHTPTSANMLRLSEVLSHIQSHFSASLTPASMARMAHMSQCSLTRSFRKITGKAPMEYVLATRLAKATDMLTDGDMNITEIAFRCGFHDSNYFTRQFRQAFGMPPRDYRQVSPTPKPPAVPPAAH